jgi:fatty acid desaturase
MLALKPRYKDGLRPFGLALSYGILGYVCGLALLVIPHLTINLVGVLLLAHAMVICAYLIHECAHNTVFALNLHNARLGACLSWLTGSCYARYEDLRRKHFRHHVERADVIGYDYRRRLQAYPRLSRLIAMLEWSYIPAVEILLHALVIVLPFIDDYYKPQRKRVMSVLVIRVLLFATLLWSSPRAFLLYLIAYMLFLIMLRFMDANQHSYDLVETHDDAPLSDSNLRNREYEFRNTYSNPISMRFPLLNLITLNFAYHNAHHERPTVPWYRLPALHHKLFGDDRRHVLSFHALLLAYHKHRVARAFRPVITNMKTRTSHGPDLQGIDGISFLIPI